MSGFSAIDLSQLPAPDVIEVPEYEVILSELKADVVAAEPALAEVIDLESEPVVKILQIFAYRELLLRARVNDAARATMLAHATGGDLDNLAALFGVSRLVVVEAQPDLSAPAEAQLETDAALRSRTQAALEGFSTAGPVGAYLFHARSADGRVTDVAVTSPSPGQVVVTVLAIEDDAPTEAVLPIVEATLTSDAVRPLTDHVIVEAAAVVPVALEAVLAVDAGPDPDVVMTAASDRLAAHLSSVRRIGRDLQVSGLYAALHVAGVRNVSLLQPAGTVAVAAGEVAIVGPINLSTVEAA